MVCDACREEAEKTNRLDLYSTYRSIIFGCKHSIEDLKRDVEEQVRLTGNREGDVEARAEYAPKVVKHSKVEYKKGRFVLKGSEGS